MAQSFLVFDFGSNEELAQQARHKVDGWKQGFRLDKKLLLKFDRTETANEAHAEEDQPPKSAPKKSSGAAKGKSKPEADSAENTVNENIRLIIRLDFSDHERLSEQRWLQRIPSEAPFKEMTHQIIGPKDDAFAETEQHFESLP